MNTPRTMRSFITYLFGIIVLSIGIGFVVKADLGVQSWQSFEVGLLELFGLPRDPYYQLIVFIESAACLPIAYFWLREKPGWGTIPITILLGPISQIPISFMPPDPTMTVRWIYLFAGSLTVSLGIGLYLNGNFGPSPQDVVYMGLINKYGLSPRQAKFALDGTMTIAGFALGGFVFGRTIGWGSIANFLTIALTVNHTMAFGRWFVDKSPQDSSNG